MCSTIRAPAIRNPGRPEDSRSTLRASSSGRFPIKEYLGRALIPRCATSRDNSGWTSEKLGKQGVRPLVSLITIWIVMFGADKPIIGMLHLPALPGSPQNKLDMDAILDRVLEDAKVLVEGGLHALVIENFGDIPFYPQQVPPHTVAFMAALGLEVKRQLHRPLGINVLRNDAESALAIAAATSAEFVRVNVHTGARLTDQGLIEGAAHRTLRYRKLLGADIKIFADVDVKHSAPIAVRELKVE